MGGDAMILGEKEPATRWWQHIEPAALAFGILWGIGIGFGLASAVRSERWVHHRKCDEVLLRLEMHNEKHNP